MEQGDTVNSEPSQDELRIRRQIEDADRVLDGLENELRGVEDEIDRLANRRHQYDLLERACAALEELDELGASDLFWDIGEGLDDAARHIGYARLQIEAFGENIKRIEGEREAVLDRIDAQNETLDCLYYELQELLEIEEQRRNEWLVERDAADVPYRLQIMPWARGCEEDERFRRSLGMSLAASVAVAFILSSIALPVAERPTVEELPERVAKLVRQERALPPPPPVVEPPPPEEAIPEPEPEIFEELPDEVTPDKPVLADAPKTDTKEQVRSKGILAFRDSFASRANLRPSAQLGSQARVSSAGEDTIGMPQRLMVSTSAPGSSGGINLADISRDVGGGGGGGMEGVQLARVASAIGGGDGPDRPLAGGSAAGRTDEEIQIVFDRYKAALYRLYNRELRKDPTLRGQMVLKLTIEPDGSVSLCELHRSDMDAPALAQQVVERVATFDFGAKEDIVAMTIIYPIDFLPAA
jgi:hypothetical protein